MPKHKISLLVIVGPTGSGKTDLAIKAANIFNGELISADSRSVYKGMDIGTAKPDSNDLGDVKIWGIDLIEPNEKYSVYEFQKYAYEKIKEIQNRDKLPILVGGSGMYIDSVILNYQFI
jgi:tRNA dimethylallyltransferase